MKTYVILLFIFLYSLACTAQDKVMVYVFLLEDCMICQSYSQTFNQIYTEYQDIKVMGVFPNFRSKEEAISDFCKEFKFPFETRTDYFKTLVKKFEVSITPEVVVYNEDKDEVIYKGRIDNAYLDLGKRRRVITHHELLDVLREVSVGNLTPKPNTRAVGCFIEKKTPLKN